MEVTIYRCTNRNYWYQKHIGNSYEVEDSFNDATRYKIKNENKTIDLEDTLEEASYNTHLKLQELDIMKAEDSYIELRDFLQDNNAHPDLKQKLYLLFINASFFD